MRCLPMGKPLCYGAKVFALQGGRAESSPGAAEADVPQLCPALQAAGTQSPLWRWGTAI